MRRACSRPRAPWWTSCVGGRSGTAGLQAEAPPAEVSLAEALSSPFFQEFRELKECHARAHEACSYSGRQGAFEQTLARYGARPTV